MKFTIEFQDNSCNKREQEAQERRFFPNIYFICPCHVTIQLIVKVYSIKCNPYRLAAGFIKREESIKDSEDIALIGHFIIFPRSNSHQLHNPVDVGFLYKVK